MGLKIIGAGYARTGTMSLQQALNQLGLGPCHHFQEVTAGVAEKLTAIKPGDTSADWDAMLGDYKSAVDWPWSVFYKELMEHSSDAKVVLTVRDPEKWYASVADTVHKMSAKAPPGALPDMLRALVWNGIFDGRFEDKEYAIKMFNDHNEAVKAAVPADRLLVFSVKDGWEPLCKFLGVPVPDGPFPHANDREAFRQKAARIKAFLEKSGGSMDPSVRLNLYNN